MDKTTKNKMDKEKCDNSPTQKQHKKSNKKPKNQSNIMTILDNASNVLIYCIYMAERLNFDIKEVILNKMEKNAVKYPVEKSKSK